MKSLCECLYESLLDDDDIVLQRSNDRTLAYQVDKMLESKTSNPELIKLLESKVAIYKVDNVNIKKLISNYIKLVGDNCSLNWIDVSNIKDLGYTFSDSKFNGDISKWDVSNVKNMINMFLGSKFNSDISSWKISKNTKCTNMFRWCPISPDYKPNKK